MAPWIRRYRLAAVLVAPSLLALAACGSDRTPTATEGGSTRSASTGRQVTGSVTVFAAASLTGAFSDLRTSLKASDPGLTVTYSFAGSGALVTQIQQRAPADVIATADTASMKRLTDAGLVKAPMTFARNKLEILVAPGNPKRIKTLADLARTDIRLVIEDESVPAGRYSAQILQAAGVTISPVSKEADVKSAVAKVTSGEADVTIVYVTDVIAAGSKGESVIIPDAQNVIAEYPIAIVEGTRNRAAAAAFVDAVVMGSGQAALAEHGFLTAA